MSGIKDYPFFSGNSQPEITPSIEDLVNIIEELKSQIIDELSVSPEGPLGKLLKEITDAMILDKKFGEESDIEFTLLNGSPKVDKDIDFHGKYLVRSILVNKFMNKIKEHLQLRISYIFQAFF